MASAVALPSTVETRTMWERQPAMPPRKDRNEPRHKMRLARKQFSLRTLLNQPAVSRNLFGCPRLEAQLNAVAGDAGARRISAETAGRVPRLGAPHGAIIVTNQDSIYGRLTDDIVDNVKAVHLRSDAPTTSRLDETMSTLSTLSTMSDCQRHRCRPSHRPSRPLNVSML
jgi:hypothetical protein